MLVERVEGKWIEAFAERAPVPVRSTGASDAIGGLEPVISALAAAEFVADCTVDVPALRGEPGRDRRG